MRFFLCGAGSPYLYTIEDDETFDSECCTEITWARYVHEVDRQAAEDIAAIRAERNRKMAVAAQ